MGMEKEGVDVKGITEKENFKPTNLWKKILSA
jgi:hypothetical protein